MKIALVAPIQNPIAMPFQGGIESQIWFLTRGLQQRGHDVTLFAPGDSDPSLPFVSIVDKSLSGGGRSQFHDNKWVKAYHRIRMNIVARSAYGRMAKLIGSQNYDIIHNNSLSTAPLVNSVNCKMPFLTTIHTPVFREIVKGAKYAQRHRSSKFVCISRFLKGSWKNYIESDVVYNGVELSKWDFGDTDVVENTALWYGRINAQKAPHLAALAAKQGGFRISLYGPIEDQSYYDQELRPLIDGENVSYNGIQEQAEIANALRKASVAIFLPQWEEPFGLTFVETLACGTPIVTFRSGAAPEILDAQSGILLERNAPVDYRQVLNEAGRLKRANCRARAREFSMDAMLANYESAYQTTIREAAIR